MSIERNRICTNKECVYEIAPVSGGLARGFTYKNQTRICKSCKHIADYQIGVVSYPPYREFTQAEIKSYENLDPKCAKCGEDTVAWDLKCPVCGSPMRYGDTIQFSD